MSETLEMRRERLCRSSSEKRSPMSCEHQGTRTITHGIVKCVDCGLNLPPREEKAKPQLVLSCPVHGEYEVTHNQKTCPACLAQAALYRQVEMDGVDALKPTDRKKQLGDCLDEAKRTICGARQDVYGNPENSFSLIAKYWNIYLRARVADGWSPPLEPKDISHMMILFKMARVQGQAPSYDNYVDLCGYAGIAADGFNSPTQNETKEDR